MIMASRVGLVLLVVIVGWFATVAGAQSRAPGLNATIGIAAYCGETYLERRESQSTFTFFSGEPVQLSVQMINRGAAVTTLRLDDVDQMLRFDLVTEAGIAPATARVEEGIWRSPSGTALVGRERVFSLSEKEAIEWIVNVDDDLPPGAYKAQLSLRAFDTEGRFVGPQVTWIDFDVRARTPASRVEVARRAIVRAYIKGDLDEADRSADQLLRLHPANYEAHVLRGQIAASRGDERAADAQFAIAQDILSRGADQLLLRFKGPQEIDQLKAAIAGMRRR